MVTYLINVYCVIIRSFVSITLAKYIASDASDSIKIKTGSIHFSITKEVQFDV